MQMGRVFFILTFMNQPAANEHITEIMREVGDALRATLLRYSELMPPALIRMGKLVLSAPGKVLVWQTLTDRGEEAPMPRWPLMVILSYQAALPPEKRSSWREAMPAAIALELAAAAADLIDEAADNDPSPVIDEYGTGQALNTANLMLVMAQQVLLWAAQEGHARALAALGALQDMLVEAAVGQHLDMSYERMGVLDVSPDMSGEMTEKKAGALMGGGFRMGALMAGADEDIIALLERIGRKVGGMAQISNDVRDVMPAETADDSASVEGMSDEQIPGLQPKTDIRLRKRSIPIVYALREEKDEPNPLQIAFSRPPDEHEDEDKLRRTVLNAGGVDFAYLVMELYQNDAIEALNALEELRPGAREVLGPLL